MGGEDLYFQITRRLDQEIPKHPFVMQAFEVLMLEFDGAEARRIIDQLMDEMG